MGHVVATKVAGVAGFEPTNAGIKIRCLNHLATPQYGDIKKVGRATRIELTTSRATIWRSNQLSYTRHHYLVRLKRFELLTHGLEGRCSIQLSYRRIRYARKKVERVMGIGPTRPAWKAGILPLNYTRITSHFAAVSTTLVYNSIIKKNCQTKITTFSKKNQKN